MKKQLAALISGGKDSLYAAYLAKKQGYDISYVVGFISENTESYMFHIPNTHLIKDIAKLMNVEYMEVRTKGVKEEELKDIETALRRIMTKKSVAGTKIEQSHDSIDGIVCGAIASDYQCKRVKKICDKLGLELVAPLWGRNNIGLLKDMVNDGFEIMITAVAAGDALDETWLGRMINDETIKDLERLQKKYGISPLGEGGELETLVTNCPLYEKRLKISLGKKHWDELTESGWIEVLKSDHR